jgi:hypothetical protein
MKNPAFQRVINPLLPCSLYRPGLDLLASMNLLTVVKKATPVFVKQPIKDAIFWRGLDAAVASKDLSALLTAWGNEGMAARRDYLETIAELAKKSTHVLECGSGLSSIVLGLAGAKVVSLEDHPEWAARVSKAVKRYSLPVTVIHAPLKSYADFDWYRQPDNLPVFDLVICDGPVSDTTRGGRMGLPYVMKNHLAHNVTIVLDDTVRPNDLDAANRWAKDFGWSITDKGSFSIIIAR